MSYSRRKGISIKCLTQFAPADLKLSVDAIATCANEIWHEYFVPIIGKEQVDYMLSKFQSAECIYADITEHGYNYFVASDIDKGNMLGYCGVVPKDGYMLLSKLYVQRDWRGKGIGKSLLDEVTALCRRKFGLDRIRLTVNKQNETAIAAYKTMGFVVVDSVKTDIGNGFFMDDFVMELLLPLNS